MLNADKEFEELKTALKNFGVHKGDILYVASDITRLTDNASGKYDFKSFDEYQNFRAEFMNSLVNCFQDFVGTEGTLLLPVFTWTFCRGKEFSVKTTKGETGALNNWVLKNRSDFRRTQHPIYSFMVWGKDADFLAGLENSDSWSEDSPFGYCHKNKAKMLMLDVVPANCLTFVHYVEERIKVPWRYLKDFVSDYTDVDGNTSRRKYSMFVRDLDIISEHFTDLSQLTFLHHEKFAEVDLYFLNFAEAFNFYLDDLKNNDAKCCYIFKNYTPDWSCGQTHPDLKLSLD